VIRSKLLGAAVAVLLAAALVVTGRVLDLDGGAGRRPATTGATRITVSTRAPTRVGGKAECPPDWPVLATFDHLSYRLSAQAARGRPGGRLLPDRRAGRPLRLRAHPPPPGVLEVGGVYLLPTGKGFRDRCRRTADRLGFAVPCPQLLPAPPEGLPPPRLCDGTVLCTPGRLLMFAQDFVVPFGYGGIDGHGVMLLVATPGRPLAGELGQQCRRELGIGETSVYGSRAMQATCTDEPRDSFFASSELLRWSIGDTFLVMAIGGQSQVNQRFAVAIADHMAMAAPRG
jgi:hypothetical protein